MKNRAILESGLPSPSLPCWPGQQGPDLLRHLWLQVLIVIRSGLGHVQDLCPHHPFLSPMLTALPLPLFPLSRPVGLDFIVNRYTGSFAFYEAVRVTERVLGRTYALQAYPEYRACFLALPSSRPGLLPSLPLPTPDAPLLFLSSLQGFFYQALPVEGARLRQVSGLLPLSLLFCACDVLLVMNCLLLLINWTGLDSLDLLKTRKCPGNLNVMQDIVNF
jgi:hypothetical protein